MLKHTLTLIYRSFKRFKSTFFINLIGLSTGLVCVLLIYLWVSDELSVDKFHRKDAQLYQILEHHQQAGKINTIDNTAGLLAKTLAEEMPEVEYAAAGMVSDVTLSSKEKKIIKTRAQFAGKDFFKMFSYNLRYGKEEQVLADKNSIVISEGLARQLFNTTENVVGKTINLGSDPGMPVIISGVFASVPTNSTAQFDCAFSFELLAEYYPFIIEWGNHNPQTYLVLKQGTDINRFNSKIEHYMDTKGNGNGYRLLFARPYSEGYLYGKYENGKQSGGRIQYVQMFSVIAVFILLIACINFMNLSTAKASRRVKEVGIKKTIGARRIDLIFQYMGEALIMSFLSLVLAVILVELLLPQFNIITGKQLILSLNLQLVLSLLGFTAITGFIAGSYPALFLSAFNPTTVLKGNYANSSKGEIWARKGLVVFQFAISVILIVSVWVVYHQISYVQNINLGYDKENVIRCSLDGKLSENSETFIAKAKNIPGVVNASTMHGNIVGIPNTTYDLTWAGKSDSEMINFTDFGIGYDVIEILGLKMAGGRSFSRDFATDKSAIILNQATVDVMGIKNPVGATVNLHGQDRKVIGVVENFHFESLHEEVKPAFMKLKETGGLGIIKIRSGQEKQTLAQLQDLYKSFNPGYTFDYKFVDSDYQALYEAERRVSTLSKYFAGLAILISSLGLFGLAAFSAERRRKEIGIRKVLGSSVKGIVILLSGDFTKLVFAAILIALPISYFVAANWLNDFAYRIALEWWYFAGAGLSALVIAWLTVGMQAVKAARANPVKSLRAE